MIPPPTHTIFHSPDLESAIEASDGFIRAAAAATNKNIRSSSSKARTLVCHKLKPLECSSSLDEISFQYYTYSKPRILAEFHVVGDQPAGQALEAYAIIERILVDLLTTNNVSFAVADDDGCGKVVRFVVPVRPHPNFSTLLQRAVERHALGGAVFIVVCASLSWLPQRSRFVTVRVPVKDPTSTAANPVLVRTLDAFLTETHADAALGRWTAVYADAHRHSYKLCGTAASVDDVCRAAAAHFSAKYPDDYDLNVDVIALCATTSLHAVSCNRTSVVLDGFLFSLVSLLSSRSKRFLWTSSTTTTTTTKHAK